jgi:hypothetical protein
VTTPSRHNGLSAERYTALVDLEPQFADALLDALREEGVAAYASPAPGIRGPYLDIQLPSTPTDRVWVDAGAADTAREVLDARRAEFHAGGTSTTPDSPPPDLVPVSPAEPAPTDGAPASGAGEEDFDAAWRAIVAGYGKTSTDQVAPWSPAEDVEEETPNAGGSWRVLRRSEPEDDAWGVPEDVARTPAEPAEVEEHYVPPPPPPLPRVDGHTKLAWVGVLGGPLLLILFTALNWSPIPGANFFAIAAFVGGFASLVYRMKDDGPGRGDDGAIV